MASRRKNSWKIRGSEFEAKSPRRSAASLFEKVLVQFLYRDLAIFTHANIVCDQQLRQLIAIDQHNLLASDCADVGQRIFTEVGCGDEDTSRCALPIQCARERLRRAASSLPSVRGTPETTGTL